MGPTACIGKPLAWAEMRVLVAKVVWRYRLEMVEESGFRWEKLRKMMVVEKEPLWVRIVGREG